MSLQIVQHSDRPELAAAARELADVWPEYNKHGDVLNTYWRFLFETFDEFQFLLYDAEQGAVVGEGHSIPCVWNGTLEGLPAGIDDVIEQGFEVKSSGAAANTLSALAVEIAPHHRGRGLSRGDRSDAGHRAAARIQERHRTRSPPVGKSAIH